MELLVLTSLRELPVLTNFSVLPNYFHLITSQRRSTPSSTYTNYTTLRVGMCCLYRLKCLKPSCSTTHTSWATQKGVVLLLANRVQLSCSHGFAPPCAAQYGVPRLAALVHPSCSHRLPPPCAEQHNVLPSAPLLQPCHGVPIGLLD